jgi:hypothetical protein
MDIDVEVTDIDREFRIAVDALQCATEQADLGGHDEAVFYLKAALAGIAAAKDLIANPYGEDGHR